MTVKNNLFYINELSKICDSQILVGTVSVIWAAFSAHL